MKQLINKLWVKFLFWLCISTLLIACSIQEIQKSAPLNPRAKWIVLPFANQSDSPEASERIADITATLLRSQHHVHLLETKLPSDEQQIPELNQQKVIDAAIKWGQEQQYHYGLGGSVQEWRYKSGLDGEPAVGITLKVFNLSTGEVVWSATGSKTGWGRESVSGTGHKLIADLLDGLPFSE